MSFFPTVEILDSTLREGEQCCGVLFPLAIKKQLAALLDLVGVDFIEVGHPAVAPSIRQAISEIVSLRLKTRLIAHARLDRDEIRLVKDLGLQWIGMFQGISPWSMKKYGLTQMAIYKRTEEAVQFARQLGLSIKFTCEDASRTDAGELIRFYEHLRALGVDRLSYADTLGILTPHDVEILARRMNGKVSFSSLQFHFHDDFGLALANATMAIECGAKCIDATILGIGERMGIVSLENLLLYLRRQAAPDDPGSGRRLEKLGEAISLVGSVINFDHFLERRFAHKSGIHIHGMLKDPKMYEAIDPALMGGRRVCALSKFLGKTGLQMLCAQYGFVLHEGEVEAVLAQIKSEELLELADAKEIVQYLGSRGLKRAE